MHARAQIRAAVAAAVTGLERTGGNVFTTRLHKLEQQTLPALLVYTLSETSERDSLGPSPGQTRVLRVAVEIAVQQIATDGLDDILDDIAAEIETAIDGNAGLAALVKDVTLDSTTITMSGEGDQRALGMVLAFSAFYRTREGDPSTLDS